MERDSEQIPSQVELSAVSWGSRWEAREDPMSTQWWIIVLQLLWFSQHCTVCSCWCNLQISVLWGWSTGQGWRRNNLECFKPEKRLGVGEWQTERTTSSGNPTDKHSHPQPHCCRLSVCLVTQAHETVSWTRDWPWKEGFQLQAEQSQTHCWKCIWHFGVSVWSVPVCHEGGTREDQKDCSCHTCASQFPARCERPAVLWPWCSWLWARSKPPSDAWRLEKQPQCKPVWTSGSQWWCSYSTCTWDTSDGCTEGVLQWARCSTMAKCKGVNCRAGAVGTV